MVQRDDDRSAVAAMSDCIAPHPDHPSPTGHWFGRPDRPLLGWLSQPAAATGRGVVIVPTVGYDYWPTHRTLRVLSDLLAEDGALVMRFDHDGTGDSSGTMLDPDRFTTWLDGVAAAAQALRDRGCSDVVLIGMQFGATLAMLASERAGCASLAMIAPVTSGRRWAREVQVLAKAVPDDGYPLGTMVHGGTLFTPALLDEIRGVDLSNAPLDHLADVLIIDRDDRRPSDLAGRCRDAGAVVRDGTLDLGTCLTRPTEYAEVPNELVAQVRSWLHALPTPVPPAQHQIPPARPGPVDVSPSASETVVHVAGLTGVWCAPVGESAGVVVLLNSGSESHIGPGRAWVELARGLAGAGWSSLRVDFTGWGESPDGHHAPGRPYDAHCIRECRDLAIALGGHGHPHPVMFGLCAGAWIALESVAQGSPFGGVIALNPQMYWQPGDPVEADIVAETHVRRMGEIAQHRRLNQFGVWDTLDQVGLRHPAAPWLDRVAESGVPVLLVFSDGDDGLEFLEQRVSRAWQTAQQRGVACHVIADVDHSFHQHWRRPALLDTLVQWLRARPATAPSNSAAASR